MMFIKLRTAQWDRPLWLFASQIIAVMEPEPPAKGGSIILMVSGEKFHVTDDPETILTVIDAWVAK